MYEIHIRIPEEMREILVGITELRGLTISSYVKHIVMENLLETSKDINHQILLNKLKLSEQKRSASYKMQKNLRDLYLPKNVLQDILRVGCTSVFLTGEVNVEMIQSIINHTLKIYSLMDDKTQELIKSQISSIKRLSDPMVLNDIINAATNGYLKDLRIIGDRK